MLDVQLMLTRMFNLFFSNSEVANAQRLPWISISRPFRVSSKSEAVYLLFLFLPYRLFRSSESERPSLANRIDAI